MTRDEALAIVCEAAGNWANEIEEYIIPDGEAHEEDDWIEAKHKQARDIEEALTLLREG